MKKIILATTAIVFGVSPVMAQSSDSAAETSEAEASTSQTDLGLVDSRSFTADTLLQQDVAGVDGEAIGEVINFEIGSDNRIQRVLINSDGLLGIDETLIAVPFSAIDLTVNEDGIRASIEEDDTDAYSIFAPDEAASTSAPAFRASSLLGDNVLLEDGEEYGYLADLVFALDGQLQAVIVKPDISFGVEGYYAFTFERDISGQEFAPSAANYTVSLDREAVMKRSAFDYEVYQLSSILDAPETEQDQKTSSQ